MTISPRRATCAGRQNAPGITLLLQVCGSEAITARWSHKAPIAHEMHGDDAGEAAPKPQGRIAFWACPLPRNTVAISIGKVRDSVRSRAGWETMSWSQCLLNPKSLLAIQQHHPEYHQDTEGQGRSRNHGQRMFQGPRRNRFPSNWRKANKGHNRRPKRRDAHQYRRAHQ